MLGKLIAVIGVLILALAAWLGVKYHTVTNDSAVPARAVIEIEKGDTFGKITQKLLAQNIAIDPLWFKAIAYQQGVINSLKPGEYELTPGLTAPQILALFVEGKPITYSVTFPEGWNLKEILQTLAKTPNLEKKLTNLSTAEIAQRLGIKEQNPEGWFFPDTYQFEKNGTDISILTRAHTRMQEVLDQEWQNKKAGLPYKTPYEALIMASIVEKETGAKSERDQIAGVFIRRLQKGMLLQTDPTVIYGMGESYQGNIRASDLKTKTAYNTYVITGLPPTPIAMPGRAAIHAAMHPADGDSLYFVARGDGSHKFSATLSDHNNAVNHFQKHQN